MKPAYQLDHSQQTGDCLRACVASILELPITDIPNFWEQTQDPLLFWTLLDTWLTDNHRLKLLVVKYSEDYAFFFDKILCIAIGQSSSKHCDQHAVVWRNGMLHNPSGTGSELIGKPEHYAVFCPLVVNPATKETEL